MSSRVPQPVGPVDGTTVPRFAGESTFARMPRIDAVGDYDIAVVGVPFMAYLLISSLTDLVAAFRPVPAVAHDHHVSHAGHGLAEGEPVMEEAGCHPRRQGAWEYRLAKLSGFAMNFGMFWMSTGLMVTLLPFFSLLSF